MIYSLLVLLTETITLESHKDAKMTTGLSMKVPWPLWNSHCFLGLCLLLCLLKLLVNRVAVGQVVFARQGVYFFLSFVGDQTQTSALPSPDWDFESHNLYCVFTFAMWQLRGIAIIKFVLMKWCGVYSNPWIIKDCFRMCTAFRLGTYDPRYAKNAIKNRWLRSDKIVMFIP